MKTKKIKFSDDKTLRNALKVVADYQKKMKKSLELIESLKEHIKNITPEEEGDFHFLVNGSLLITNYKTTRTVFDRRSFEKEQKEAYDSYLIDTLVSTVKFEK